MNKIWLMLPLTLALGTAMAQNGAQLSKQQLAKQLHGVDAGDISKSPLKGLYQVTVGPNVAYVSADGRYLLQGELYDLKTKQNLTEKVRAKERVGLLAGIRPDQEIVYKPKNGKVKHTITVFTDIDCGYCREFHSHINTVTALGIEVRYLSFPRTGPNTSSWTKAEQVWCAKDRKAALTRAKLGANPSGKVCANNPVGEDYDLGHQLGVTGTPAIFASNGELLGGYLSPSELAKSLAEVGSQ